MKRWSALVLLVGITASLLIQTSAKAATRIYSFQAEVWADNWFSLYVNGKKVGEDSIPFETERSFNSEIISFKASYPLTIGIIARDFVENSSGLEYIGKPNQQIGDGGVIAQIRETSSGQVIGATGNDWKVYVVNRAPLNSVCVKSKKPLIDCKSFSAKNPTNWYSLTFKDAAWKSASVYTETEVGTKEGYYDFSWSKSAKLIWSSDLRIDNTILLRGKIAKPKDIPSATNDFTLTSPEFINGGFLPKDYTCDGSGISPALKFSGIPEQAVSLAVIMDTVPGPLRPGEVDSGNHFYLILYNIPKTSVSIPAGNTIIGTLGQNFQGKRFGYTPPCSQGSGVKEYTITAFALSSHVDLPQNMATEKALLEAISQKILAKSAITAKYQRP